MLTILIETPSTKDASGSFTTTTRSSSPKSFIVVTQLADSADSICEINTRTLVIGIRAIQASAFYHKEDSRRDLNALPRLGVPITVNFRLEIPSSDCL